RREARETLSAGRGRGLVFRLVARVRGVPWRWHLVCTVRARSATCNEKGIAGVFLSSLHFNARRVVAPSCRDLRCSPMVQNTSYAAETRGSLLVLVLLALIVGAAAGLGGAIFRLTLEQPYGLREALIAWAQGEKLAGFLFVVATCAAAALIAAWLVRRFSPHASGSGIPHVEAVLNEEIPPAPFHLIWVKFCGGVLAIGSGL